MTSLQPRLCLECRKEVKGRTDKKFCDDQCRNTFHNKQNAASSSYVKRVNKILRKNRSILRQLNTSSKATTTRRKLVDLGFDTRYYTDTQTTNKGQLYYFCYEHGYLPLENGYFALVVKHDTVDGW